MEEVPDGSGRADAVQVPPDKASTKPSELPPSR
jgi:hypothetical protein